MISIHFNLHSWNWRHDYNERNREAPSILKVVLYYVPALLLGRRDRRRKTGSTLRDALTPLSLPHGWKNATACGQTRVSENFKFSPKNSSSWQRQCLLESLFVWSETLTGPHGSYIYVACPSRRALCQGGFLIMFNKSSPRLKALIYYVSTWFSTLLSTWIHMSKLKNP